MNPKSTERAIERYRAYKDEDVRSRLAIFGPLLIESAALSNEFGAEDLEILREPAAEDVLAASKGGDTLLSQGLVQIRASSFERCAKRMADVLLASLEPGDDLRKEAEAVDWSLFTTAELSAAASRNPLGYLQEVVKVWGEKDESLLDLFVLPVLGETLRAFLDRFAVKASALLESSEPKKPSYARRKTCFCCGAEPDLAAVVETTFRGNVKKLYCGACGASWTFERIRCVRCGNETVSELTYISDEADDSHRMHVCSACGGAMPTLFALGDELTFTPDVEAVVFTGLEEAYEAAKAEGTLPKPVLKPVDSTQVGRAPGRQSSGPGAQA